MSTQQPARAPQPARVPLSASAAVRMIAAREVRLRLRSKAFVLVTALTAVALVAVAVVVAVVRGGSAPPVVAVTAAEAAQLAPELAAAAEGAGTPVEVRTVADDAAGRAAVDRGEAEAFVRASAPDTVGVVVAQGLDAALRSVVQTVAERRVLAAQVAALGGRPAQVAAAVAAARVQVDPLDPPPAYDPQRLVVGVVAGILVYLAMMLAGQTVAQGVVEEKASRVVELLLAAVRPWQIMVGKVVGLGALGLLQMLVAGGAGIVAGQLTGALDLPWAAATGIVGWLLVWFLLGYAAYAFAFAALGALVSRQEDVAGVVTPVTMLLVVGYLIGVSVLPADPSNAVVAVLSVVPVFSPTLMPIRMAIGGVPWWQTGLSLALMLATIPLLVALAARIYRNAVVRSGARVRLRDALRQA